MHEHGANNLVFFLAGHRQIVYECKKAKADSSTRVSQITQPLLRKLSNIPYIVGNHPSQTDF